MLLSAIEELRFGAVYPEVAGARVLISGVSARFGVDISRAFADHATKLLLQVEEPSTEMDEVTAILAQTASNVKLYEHAELSPDDAVAFVTGPGQKAFGGLDIVINLIDIAPDDLVGAASLDDAENIVSRKLTPPVLMGRVAANRMALTMTQGLILNVINTPPITSARDGAMAAMVGSALSGVTRDEAAHWAEKGIRINAIVPGSGTSALAGARDSHLQHSTEPEVAALALYLASNQGAELTGHVFDASRVTMDRVTDELMDVFDDRLPMVG